MNFLYCVLYLIALSAVIYFIGRIFPRKWIYEYKFPFKSYNFEKNGKIYEKLKIRKWKTKWPDASLFFNKLFPKKIPKKRIEDNSKDGILVLVKESCVAESTHLAAMLFGFFCTKIWKGLGGWIISVIFFIGNIPSVLIQRYNRPRLIKVLNMY